MHPPRFAHFPYTTLFRSVASPKRAAYPMVSASRVNQITAPAVDPETHTPISTATAVATAEPAAIRQFRRSAIDRKSTRLNSSHVATSYAVFCLQQKTHTR